MFILEDQITTVKMLQESQENVKETNLKSEHYVNFVKTFFLRSILRILCKHEI